jgi:hypothetical protein
MIQIKTFVEYNNNYDLDKQVNEFLVELQKDNNADLKNYVTIRDIKYAHSPDTNTNDSFYTAMVIYDK